MKHDVVHGAAIGRRGLLGLGFALAADLAIPRVAAAKPVPTRSLKFRHLHTGERLSIDYWSGGAFDRGALARINHLLRDFRNDETRPIDPRLLDVLFRLRTRMDSDAEIEIISGYRSPRTNAMLARRSGGVARKSLHMKGMAIDIRLPQHDLDEVYRTARNMRAGGVGLYPRSRFVHLDVGRVRSW